ncbi:hypothetical protein QTP86_018811 [Hemibagrus guttatus]|nr:hypothetical protein QTP86_018811 [Hemibagrus guttatus]
MCSLERLLLSDVTYREEETLSGLTAGRKIILTEEGERFYTNSTRQVFSILSVKDSDSGTYTCRGNGSDSQSSEISDAVTLTVSAKPKPTVRVNPQSSVYTGDTVTLSCELQRGDWMGVSLVQK